MKSSRRSYTAAFKAKVALEAIKADQTIDELAQHFDVHQSLIIEWTWKLRKESIRLFERPSQLPRHSTRSSGTPPMSQPCHRAHVDFD